MDRLESKIAEYESMDAIEKLNYFRNLHYSDGNNTETGLVANAINDILPEHVKFKETFTEPNPVNLIHKARLILSNGYAHIVRENATVEYFENCGKLQINFIEFVSDGTYQDKIRVTNRGILLFEEDGLRYILLTYKNWNEFLAITRPNLRQSRF